MNKKAEDDMVISYLQGTGVWDQYIKPNLMRLHNFIKENKLVSKGLSKAAEFTGNPLLSGASKIADRFGYGNMKYKDPVIEGMMGNGVWDKISPYLTTIYNYAKKYIKDNKLISQGLQKIQDKVDNPIAKSVVGAVKDKAKEKGFGKQKKMLKK